MTATSITPITGEAAYFITEDGGPKRLLRVALAGPNGEQIGGQVSTLAVVIASGTSLSGAIDLGMARLARIDMPSGWDAASLTFQASPDGQTCNNLYDSLGVEYAVAAAASRAIIVPLVDFMGIRWLKIRSGTSGAPVNQTADRTLTLTLVP
jgi:hypothetical protein